MIFTQKLISIQTTTAHVCLIYFHILFSNLLLQIQHSSFLLKNLLVFSVFTYTLLRNCCHRNSESHFQFTHRNNKKKKKEKKEKEINLLFYIDKNYYYQNSQTAIVVSMANENKYWIKVLYILRKIILYDFESFIFKIFLLGPSKIRTLKNIESFAT